MRDGIAARYFFKNHQTLLTILTVPVVPSSQVVIWNHPKLLLLTASVSVHLKEREIHSGDKQEESHKVIPVQMFVFEKDGHKDGEDCERDHLLDDLELHEAEWPTILRIPDSVGWHHKQILKQGNTPREQDDNNQWPVCTDALALQFEVSIPCEGHDNVAHNEQRQCGNSGPVHFSKNCLGRTEAHKKINVKIISVSSWTTRLDDVPARRIPLHRFSCSCESRLVRSLYLPCCTA